ncbi:unnamed protein product [Zymoseptoria tritici ST99CH_1A5]|uniref:DEP domain-containing protein n=1 Tax=Zymoseptoria tritici ST99CH_1A5 TaxID=1276529 RepID=A0A1Y6LWP2_ZYMTR|nr:unnamed protein product [Zymoseptoria tritici ST99CH_1A5]
MNNHLHTTTTAQSYWPWMNLDAIDLHMKCTTDPPAGSQNPPSPLVLRVHVAATNSHLSQVHGALLSEVAAALFHRLTLRTRVRDEKVYKNTFTGLQAVGILSSILQTSDRNLACFVGRALEVEGMFRQVEGRCKLIDNRFELYQFVQGPVEVHGVCEMLTKCYSSTCGKGGKCCSVSCPRRPDPEEGKRRVWRRVARKAVKRYKEEEGRELERDGRVQAGLAQAVEGSACDLAGHIRTPA